jgi:hypothetical protein
MMMRMVVAVVVVGGMGMSVVVMGTGMVEVGEGRRRWRKS